MKVALLIITGVFLFELIIFFHELGHFLAAKKSGVKVNEFALGMGPKILSFKRGETIYSLRLLPIGGFCSMEGEDQESDNPRAFNNAKIGGRMAIIIAGAVMNIILGVIFMFFLLVQPAYLNSTVIQGFPPYSFSANSGLEPGDRIVRLNNYAIDTTKDLSFAISTIKLSTVNGGTLNIFKQDAANELTKIYTELSKSENMTDELLEPIYNTLHQRVKEINQAGTKEAATSIMQKCDREMRNMAGIEGVKPLTVIEKETSPRYRTEIVVVRDGKRITLTDVDFYTYMPQRDKDKAEEAQPAVGIDFYVEPVKKNVFTLISYSFRETVSVVRMVWSSLGGMVTGRYSIKEISGPIGVTSAISKVASEGLKTPGFAGLAEAANNILFMMMVITVNLGIVNLLPFPALDGGRFVFLLIEAIRKKPIPYKYEAIVNGAGFALLMVFMVLISFKDIWQLFQ